MSSTHHELSRDHGKTLFCRYREEATILLCQENKKGKKNNAWILRASIVA